LREPRDPESLVTGLSCWHGPVDPQPVAGGITNTNFSVVDQGRRYFVRIGNDIPEHGIVRANELAANLAAHAAGVAPAVIHSEPGALVLEFIPGRTFTAADARNPRNLERIVDLLKRCHRGIPEYLRGPGAMFWVFHVVRDYAHTLNADNSRHRSRLPQLLGTAARLEKALGPVDIVFGHNDLLPTNFIDDGERLWLVDWEYAGFNSPLFDLAGLASNNEFPADLSLRLLESYYGRVVDRELKRRFAAMNAASLLRETMWSMVSEIHSKLDFDYVAYTAMNLARFESALAAFGELEDG